MSGKNVGCIERVRNFLFCPTFKCDSVKQVKEMMSTMMCVCVVTTSLR